MAATMIATTLSADAAAVVRAASRSFARMGETVVVGPVADIVVEAETAEVDMPAGLHAVVVPELRRLECIAGEPSDPALRTALIALVRADWDAVALVPASKSGEAHRSLRGTGARLQPWWREADGSICFGRVEVA